MLWGGNLCVLTSLLGTPYFPVVDKGVLFIEDTNEHPYRIERMLDSCIILENWTSGAYSGKSYNTFNGTTQKWQQYWVDNAGGVTEYFDGHYEDGKMIFQTANVKQFDGKVKIMKMTFFNLGVDKVRQFGESSVDNGKTWTVDFDLEYRRK